MILPGPGAPKPAPLPKLPPLAKAPLPATAGYQPLQLGPKAYGPGGIGAATSGPLSKVGYRQRDREAQARQLAIKNRLNRGGAGGYTDTTLGGY